MIKVENVNVNIEAQDVKGYGSTEGVASSYQLNIGVRSDSREFLERISQAVHRELAAPEKAPTQ